MPAKRTVKRPPKETNELAKYVLDAVTGDTAKIEPPAKNPHAQALSKLGASKGGQSRALRLSSKKKREIARKGAEARWKSSK